MAVLGLDARTQQGELALHRAYFEALDALLGTLSTPLPQEDSLSECLRILACAARQSAAALYLNDSHNQVALLRTAWGRPGTLRLEEQQPLLNSLPYEHFPILADTLAIGMIFHKRIDDLHPIGQAIFAPLGVKHLLCIPLLDRDIPFGFLAFLDLEKDTQPSALEMRLMATLTNHLAQSLLKQKMEAELQTNQQRLKALVGATKDMVFEFGQTGIIERAWSGLPCLPDKESLINQPLHTALPTELVQGIERSLPRLLNAAGRFAQFNCTLHAPEGSTYLLVRLQSVDAPGQLRNVVAMVQDVSTFMQDAARKKTMLDTLNLLEEAVIDLSPDGILLETTPAWARLRGIEVQGMYPEWDRPLTKWIQSEDQSAFTAMLHKLRDSSAVQTGRFRLLNETGDAVWVELRLIAHRAPDGTLAGARGVLRDVTTAHMNEQHITQLALYDNLTKLPNRLLLDNQLFQALDRARKNQTRVALGFIDLDHFKQVNDVFGHKVGDELLVNLAQQLSGAVRESDTLARWGGDEFIALLPDLTDLEEMRAYAEALRRAAQTGVMIEGLETRPTISVGFAVFPDDAETGEELMSAADLAMYRAKSAGRNNVCFYADLAHSKSQDREHMTIQVMLDSAIRQDRLEVFYQPIMNARTREVMAVEALARWQDEGGEWVSPDLFIPMAEKAGLIQELSAHVMAHSFAQLALWRAAGLQQRLMLNISRSLLMQPELIQRICAELHCHGLTPQDVILEITESVALTDYSRQMAHLRQLSDAGFLLAIDDFGTGYSSLSQLHEIPARYLKVDMSFTQRLHTLEGRSVMHAIIQMGQRLGLEIVAEGIEDAATERTLLELGADHVQGYFYCEPSPPEAIDVWLRLGMRSKK